MTRKRINSIIKKIIEEELSFNQANGKDDHTIMLSEMATFGSEKWGKKQYKIAIHGINAGDRPTPHIHIYITIMKEIQETLHLISKFLYLIF